MQEARELAKESTFEYDAHPLEDNIFEWHFTVRGPKDTDFEEGRYHGRIILPSEYPFKPPEIIFLTPNGRFELNTKICLSITGFHPEFWQPAWGIRTVLLAVIGFFPTEARGAIGGLDYSKEERRRLAKNKLRSVGWVCPTCQVDTKDALSDIPPDTPAAEKEVLPDFMMSYKEADSIRDTAEGSSDKSQKSSDTVEGSSDTSQKSSDTAERSGDTAPTIEKQASPQEINDHDETDKTEVDKTAKDKTAIRKVIESAEECESAETEMVQEGTFQTNTPRQQGELVQQEGESVQPENGVVQQQTVENVTMGRSPMWLDALIGGLVSLLVALICRKYAM
ncbi:hypothetical protein INT47_013252 [Mucor saturninus]|uniref:UBC core domain-containing protein n=1 Tax=Mucor saturninus TaxID=64648 RepID=A0A8H7R272_9FUNG|nr:hypothetical protein INT47_013252 [Mucor saturninus]